MVSLQIVALFKKGIDEEPRPQILDIGKLTLDQEDKSRWAFWYLRVRLGAVPSKNIESSVTRFLDTVAVESLLISMCSHPLVALGRMWTFATNEMKVRSGLFGGHLSKHSQVFKFGAMGLRWYCNIKCKYDHEWSKSIGNYLVSLRTRQPRHIQGNHLFFTGSQVMNKVLARKRKIRHVREQEDTQLIS